MGCSLLVLREGLESDCCYWGRNERRTISMQGGVGGGCISEYYWLIEFLLDHMSNFLRWAVAFLFSFFFFVFFFFFHANVKQPLKPWTIIVLEDIANSCFRSSTVKSRACLLSRLVPVLNDTHSLSRIIHQLLHVSLLCKQYILTVFIYLPLVIDLVRTTEIPGFLILSP